MAIKSITASNGTQNLMIQAASLIASKHELLVEELIDEMNTETSNQSIVSNNENIYHLVMRFTLDGEEQNVEFDQVEDVSVTASSELTEHPLVNGDIICDHMIRKPTTMSFSGMFSLMGNQRTQFYGSGGRLVNIQEYFERLKNEGVRCQVIKMSGTASGSARFLARDNMVINSITWTEHQNSLSFSFSLTEVMTIDVEEVRVADNDDLLPSIQEATTLNVVEKVVDLDDCMIAVIQEMLDKNVATEDFINYYGEWASLNLTADTNKYVGEVVAAIVIVGVTSVTALAIVIGIGFLITSIVTSGGALAILLVFAVAVLACYNWFKKIFSGINWKKKWGVEKFKYKKNNEDKNIETSERFTEFLAKIYAYYDTALSEYLHLYGFEYDEEQRVIFSFDGDYYVFLWYINNEGYYGVELYDIDENLLASQYIATGQESIGDCTSSNYFYKTKNGAYIYLLHFTEDESLVDENGIALDRHDLRRFYILTSTMQMDNFNQLLLDMVEDAMES